MIRQYELVERVKAYDPGVDEALLNRAYVFAMRAHGSQTRASGDPYFSHPLEVAGILTDLKLDTDTIVTALLHDVVEDTLATIPEIEELFGPKIAELVDGVTKLSLLEYQSPALGSKQAENFRKFVLALSNDIRVLLVKLADRLHNMQTIHFIKKPEKRQRIARETMDIYAPLAERIGMHQLKDDLEHLSFEQIDPEAMETIRIRLSYLIEQNPTLERDMIDALEAKLREHNIKGEVKSRIKSPFSIWRKMELQQISFEQLSDVMAFRVVVEDVATCYQALGIVHQSWPLVPGRFKDYISTPKANFYRSIHTTVLGPHRRRLEVQLRTDRMHAEAELGVAAHWQYKNAGDPLDGSQYRWVRQLLEILEHASTPEEFLEHTKLELFQDKVFAFTPKGELVSLPRGSTIVDFAYGVHTEVGDHCVSAKVNGRMVPLRYHIENGDQIEILTSNGQTPSPRWESFVVTGKARSAIRRFMRMKHRSEFIQLGKTLLEKSCRRNKLDYSEAAFEQARLSLGIESLDELFALAGQGTIQEEELLRATFPGFENDIRHQKLPKVHKASEEVEAAAIKIFDNKSSGVINFAMCCHPIRGDRIVGIHMEDKGLDVHRIDCEVLDGFDDRPELWNDMAWDESVADGAYYVGRLRIEAVNEMGALANIAAITAKAGANFSNIQIEDRDSETYVMLADVDVRDVKHLSDLQRAMRSSRSVMRVDRENFRRNALQ